MFETLIELAGSSQAWIALVTLTFMEVILGIDNIIFISIVANKLPAEKQEKARRAGLLIAMGMRVLLLLGLGILLKYMHTTWFVVDFWGIKGEPNGEAFVLVAGGLFLLYKTIKELHHKLEGQNMSHEEDNKRRQSNSFRDVVIQISIINLVFSVDSILTAVGMTRDIVNIGNEAHTDPGYHAIIIMILGVVLSVLIMMQFAGPIGNYINRHPSIQILALSFLLLISFMLLAEGSDAANAWIGSSEVKAIPKGYLYFAIAFSTMVQLLVIRNQKVSDPVQLHGPIEEAEEKDLLK
jgi:predicted tellurium resistance membrane protein TerC